ncbi:hypothetical protein BLNAU_2217 [Blattamonas nauphoetae]|uniref:Uncharacterized protein n=1 Tax=Blattamonas nauphoetae TaxID=2049346 RepID=A0ABQ9YG96_9EUKA|nr:hypothetical protein BLNAU_2217 [Blattamonas nauphoetae]
MFKTFTKNPVRPNKYQPHHPLRHVFNTSKVWCEQKALSLLHGRLSVCEGVSDITSATVYALHQLINGLKETLE